MKRIIIIGEGQTEQEFCNDVLQPHFNQKDIYLENAVIAKTKGGIVNWPALKYQIETCLKIDKTAFVTTFIDYYGIYNNHDYPNWEKAKNEMDKTKRMDMLETGMLDDIQKSLQRRFKPYIQLHEFEGLLFNDISIFKQQLPPDAFTNIIELENVINAYPNPEMINDNRETAPSKRLSKLIRGYNKRVYGTIIAQAIGLPTIRSKCPRFNEWILKLENI